MSFEVYPAAESMRDNCMQKYVLTLDEENDLFESWLSCTDSVCCNYALGAKTFDPNDILSISTNIKNILFKPKCAAVS